jgi:hypothetical protein
MRLSVVRNLILKGSSDDSPRVDFCHRCSWITVYVFGRNAQSKSHSDPHDVCTLSCSINCPTVICLPSMCYLSYGETPLVNCGPRSNFLYIVLPFYFTHSVYFLAYYYPITTRYAQSFVYSKPVRLTTSS